MQALENVHRLSASTKRLRKYNRVRYGRDFGTQPSLWRKCSPYLPFHLEVAERGGGRPMKAMCLITVTETDLRQNHITPLLR